MTQPYKVLKNRLSKEGSESVTKCNRLKLEAADGKKCLTGVASPLISIYYDNGKLASNAPSFPKSQNCNPATENTYSHPFLL